MDWHCRFCIKGDLIITVVLPCSSLQSVKKEAYVESSKMVKRKQGGAGDISKKEVENISSSVWHRHEWQRDWRQQSWKSRGDSSQATRLSAHQ